MNIMLVIANTASIIDNKFIYGLIFVKNNDNVQNNKVISSVIKVNLLSLFFIPVYFGGDIFLLFYERNFFPFIICLLSAFIVHMNLLTRIHVSCILFRFEYLQS